MRCRIKILPVHQPIVVMKALKILLYIVLGLGALWMLLGLFAKKDYRIERSTEIAAPREIIYDQVRFFKNLKNWSPWHVYDPAMKTEITGTDGEAGARYNWSGNDKVGKGYQQLKSTAPERIEIDVNWGWGISPVAFSLEALPDDKTKVTWSMDMHVAFPWNAFAMLTDVNAFVGKDFENGLANLKKVCEQIAHPRYRGYEVVETELPIKYYIGVRKVVDTAELTAYFQENISKIARWMSAQKIPPGGAPAGLYWTWGATTDMAAAIPAAADTRLDSTITFPVGGATALVIDHTGPYEGIGEAHFAMDDYMAEKKLRNIPPVIEEYVSGPADEPDTLKWLTKIIYFVAPATDSTVVEKK